MHSSSLRQFPSEQLSFLAFLAKERDGWIGAARVFYAAPEMRAKDMDFRVTNEGRILRVADDLRDEVGRRGAAFATEEELHDLAGASPMKRLLQIWNRLPDVQRVNKFENRRIAIRRIWRAIARESDRGRGTAVPSSRGRTANRSHTVSTSGSKAALVYRLIERPEGATLDEIRRATGWQAHTVRGFISRTLGKQRRGVRSFRKNGACTASSRKQGARSAMLQSAGGVACLATAMF